MYVHRKVLKGEIAQMKAGTLRIKRKPGSEKDESEYMFPSFRPRSNLDETEDAVYDFCFSPGPIPDKNLPNNLATAVTLPCRGNSNLQYNNTGGNSGVPESPKYKTLVFLKQ